MPTLATHVIWSTYLTWLPGDPRGHWSPLFDLYGHLVCDGCQLNLPDAATMTYARSIAREPEKVLTPQEMEVVASVIGEMAGPDLPVYAQAVERTHVHLLLGPMADDLAKVVGRIKGRSSSRVLALPQNAGRRRTWGEGYWNVWLFDMRAVGAVQEYVGAHNVRKGLAAAPYPWVRSLGG